MADEVVGSAAIPSGPTVLTMKWAFDRLLEPTDLALGDLVKLHRCDVLARHAWPDGSRLDLMADLDEAADAIGRFAGPGDARGFRAFSEEASRIHDILLEPHMRAQRPSFVGLMGRIGARRLPDMMALRPYTSLWRALGQRFRDPRLRQLFGRYATYTGSSPYSIPATLMLVAHVEREGVWRIEGGMSALAAALRGLAERLGVDFRTGQDAAGVVSENGRAVAVTTGDGDLHPASAVVLNVDPSSAARLSPESGVRAIPPSSRSLSAVTWCAKVRTSFPFAHHTVFFSDDYEREFRELRAGRVPDDPTTYACAPDRDDAGGRLNDAADERLLLLVNAPPNGDTRDHDPEAERCRDRMTALLRRCGAEIEWVQARARTPTGFAALYPESGGALYGRTNDGPFAGFKRPGARTAVPNLTMAGGGCHPGPGVPMSTVSGMLAAEHLMAALASTRLSRPAAISGGISTGSATTAAMPSP